MNAVTWTFRVGKKMEAHIGSCLVVLIPQMGVTSDFQIQADSSQAPREPNRTWLVLLGLLSLGFFLPCGIVVGEGCKPPVFAGSLAESFIQPKCLIYLS